MPTVMALSGSDERRPRCKNRKTKSGTKRYCPVEQNADGTWKWQQKKSRRSRR
jgi:hypothetical protein